MLTGFTVRVPATVANVGPGFDALAFALEWFNEIHVQPASALEVEVEGEGANDIDRGEDNLVVRAMSRVLGAVPRARVSLVNHFPFGRGFGSSAAAIVGGLVAATHMKSEKPDRRTLDDAIEMEGHADNVSACLLGGITVSLPGAPTARLDPPAALRPLAAVAPETLSTHSARKALPETVSFTDAALTAARAARLTAALAAGDGDALMAATDDVLHQPARFALAPDSGSFVARLREAGFAAFLAGAGPSIAAIVPAELGREAESFASGCAPPGWDVRSLEFSARGAEVVVSD
ncbi:MAG: homoserine kinase [Actinomycetota bacterium]|nr:homoserine kinase [Actinomycetota bacterium]